MNADYRIPAIIAVYRGLYQLGSKRPNDGMAMAARYRTCLLLVVMVLAGLSQASGNEQRAIEIAHRYGTTEIKGTPRRVVSLSFIGHDFLLALGVKPVALRYWYGQYPFGVWPWAQDALGDAEPVVMRGELDIELIASLEPDLIVGIWSGMSEDDYRLLSRIAPTVAPTAEHGDYGTPWRAMMRTLGKATGRSDEAERTIDGVDRKIARLRTQYPDWQGKSATFVWPGELGAYTSRDIRGRLLAELGFEVAAAVDDLRRGDLFYVLISEEDLSPIDTDVLIWLHSSDAPDRIRGLPLRKTMRAYKEGRELYADEILSSALSHSSPLSLDYALDRLAPLLAQATDGDPGTRGESSAKAGLVP